VSRASACAAERASAKVSRRVACHITATTEVKDHCGGYHGDDGAIADRVPEPAAGEFIHATIGCAEPKGASAGETDGMNALDETTGLQGIGFSAAGCASAHIDGCNGAVGSEDDRCAGAPLTGGALVVANSDTGDITDVTT